MHPARAALAPARHPVLLCVIAMLSAGCTGTGLGPTHFQLPRVHESIPGAPVTAFRFAGYVKGSLSVPLGTITCGSRASSVDVQGMLGGSPDQLTITGLKPGEQADFVEPAAPDATLPVVILQTASQKQGFAIFYAGTLPSGVSTDATGQPSQPPAGVGHISVNASGRYGVVNLTLGTAYPQGTPLEHLAGSWFCA